MSRPYGAPVSPGVVPLPKPDAYPTPTFFRPGAFGPFQDQDGLLHKYHSAPDLVNTAPNMAKIKEALRLLGINPIQYFDSSNKQKRKLRRIAVEAADTGLTQVPDDEKEAASKLLKRYYALKPESAAAHATLPPLNIDYGLYEVSSDED